MHSDLHRKIEKARHYAKEPERITISALKARFQGTNSEHTVTLTDGSSWHCDSASFQSWGTSPHIMALQRLLDPMLPADAKAPGELGGGHHMHSELYSKIEKARRYAAEPERVTILELKARFQGTNSEHEIALHDGQWHADGEFFRNWGTSSHIMALQRILRPMLPPEALQNDFLPNEHSETETASV
jgi:hypothetical protein